MSKFALCVSASMCACALMGTTVSVALPLSHSGHLGEQSKLYQNIAILHSPDS